MNLEYDKHEYDFPAKVNFNYIYAIMNSDEANDLLTTGVCLIIVRTANINR